VLWPQLIAADPMAGAGLTELSAEHNTLDAALDTLAAVPVQDDDDGVRLAVAAVIVRDLVHKHLEREEPLLFPTLAANISDQAWTEFSRAVIASAPPVGAHLNIGFFELLGSRAELAVITANLPPAALPFVPAMREQARATLNSLQATDHGRMIIG
jgi:hypothetical protein